jgi:hypothetical protein
MELMHKLHIKTPKLNKEKTLVTLGVVIALGLLSWGIVRYEQHRKLVAAQTEQINSQLAKPDAATQAQLSSDNATVKVQAAETVALCSFIKANVISTAKKPVAYPVICASI